MRPQPEDTQQYDEIADFLADEAVRGRRGTPAFD